MKVQVKVAGWAKLTSNIEELERRIQRGAMRDSMTKAQRIMVAAAKSNAPTGRTGLLKRSIKAKIFTQQKKGRVSSRIGASYGVVGTDPTTGQPVKAARYLGMVEYGTASRGVWGHTGWRLEPGNPPNPFMRRAFASTSEAVRAKYFEEMAGAISRAAARIHKTAMSKLPNR